MRTSAISHFFLLAKSIHHPLSTKWPFAICHMPFANCRPQGSLNSHHSTLNSIPSSRIIRNFKINEPAMADIILYIATSIDGYIADADGSVDWLEQIPNPEKTDYGYGPFMENIDTVVMGRKTYEKVKSFDMEWPYSNGHTVVITSDRSYETDTPNTSILSTLNRASVERLRLQSTKDIWLVGGGELVTSFLKMGTIDRILLFMMPIILGSGIPLFPGKGSPVDLHLVQSRTWNSGVVLLEYDRQMPSRND